MRRRWFSITAATILTTFVSVGSVTAQTCEGLAGEKSVGSIEWGGYGQTPITISLQYKMNSVAEFYRPEIFIDINVSNVRTAFADTVDSVIPDSSCRQIFTNHNDTKLEIVKNPIVIPSGQSFRVGGSVNARLRLCNKVPCGFEGKFPKYKIKKCPVVATLATKTINYNMFFSPIYDYGKGNKYLDIGSVVSAELEYTPQVTLFEYSYRFDLSRKFIVPSSFVSTSNAGLPIGSTIIDFHKIFDPDEKIGMSTDGENISMRFAFQSKHPIKRELACALFERLALQSKTDPPPQIKYLE